MIVTRPPSCLQISLNWPLLRPTKAYFSALVSISLTNSPAGIAMLIDSGQ